MRIMIEVPDDLHAWIAGGRKPGDMPESAKSRGIRLATGIIEAGISEPKTCATCDRCSTSNFLIAGEPSRTCLNTANVIAAAHFCAAWEARQ